MVWTVDDYENRGGSEAEVKSQLRRLEDEHGEKRVYYLEILLYACQNAIVLAEILGEPETVRIHEQLQASILEEVTDEDPVVTRFSESLRSRFQQWAASVRKRATRGPIAFIDGTYRAEPLSHGLVGKELGPAAYDAWKNDGAKVSFLDWLRSADGRLALKQLTVMQPELNDLHVLYLTPDDRPDYRLRFAGGQVYRGQETRPFDPADHGQKEAIFVLDLNNHFYAGFHKTGQFHHSSFLSGGPVKGAGRMTLKEGVIQRITPHSGHYGPSTGHMLNVLRALLVKLNDGPMASLQNKSPAEIRQHYLESQEASKRAQQVLGKILVQDSSFSAWYPALEFLIHGGDTQKLQPLYV